jgi:integrase
MGGNHMAASEPIRNKKEIKEMAAYWLKLGNARNYLLVILGVNTALRCCDFLRLRWEDVYDFEAGRFRSHIVLIEKKTGKQKIILLNAKVLKALRLCMSVRRGEFLFANNRKEPSPICRSQAWRIIKTAARAIKAVGKISCHSLRKTFGYFAWKMGVLPVMLMDIYNHSSFETTKRYLGIAQEDRDAVYLGVGLG